MISNVTMKNTLQSGATLKRAEHSRSHVLTQHDYTASGGKEQVMVCEILEVGEINALSPDYLRVILGFKSTPMAIRKFCITLENRANRTLDALNGARKLLEEFEKADKE